MRKLRFWAVLLPLVTLLAGAARAAEPAPSPIDEANERKMDEIIDRKIFPGDTILIEVFGERDLSLERKVQATGTILFPLLQVVQVAGKTPGEIASYLQEALDKDFLVDPQVSVTVKDYATRTVNVTGSVFKPGAYIIPGEVKWTILDALGAASGLTPRGNPNKIEFTRRGKTVVLSYEKLKKEDPKKAIIIEPGDLIDVSEKFF